MGELFHRLEKKKKFLSPWTIKDSEFFCDSVAFFPCWKTTSNLTNEIFRNCHWRAWTLITILRWTLVFRRNESKIERHEILIIDYWPGLRMNKWIFDCTKFNWKFSGIFRPSISNICRIFKLNVVYFTDPLSRKILLDSFNFETSRAVASKFLSTSVSIQMVEKSLIQRRNVATRGRLTPDYASEATSHPHGGCANTNPH